MPLKYACMLACSALIVPLGAAAQSYSPYSDFQSLTPPEFATLQVKLTYLGPVDSPVRSLVLVPDGGMVDIAAFTPFRRSGHEPQYGLDGVGVISGQVSTVALQAMIDSVAALSAVIAGGVDSIGRVSFALIETSGGTRAFEAIVDSTNGCALIERMLSAFVNEPAAMRLTQEAACRLDLLAAGPPSEVTSSVQIKSSGLRRLRGTDEYLMKVRITNTSGVTLDSPFTLVPGIAGENVALVGESGYTCRIAPMAEAYVDLPVGSGLAPSATVEVTLKLRNPSKERVAIAPRAYAGSGVR